MAIELLPVASLKPYVRNARKHSDKQLAQIRASMLEFGWTSPALIDDDMGILAGHARVTEATKMWAEGLSIARVPDGLVPCVRIGGMSPEQKRAYILADNRIPMSAGWDGELLSIELTELNEMKFDVALAGFSAAELKTLTGTADTSPQLVGGFKFSVQIACKDAVEQKALIERFEKEGLVCRPLITS